MALRDGFPPCFLRPTLSLCSFVRSFVRSSCSLVSVTLKLNLSLSRTLVISSLRSFTPFPLGDFVLVYWYSHPFDFVFLYLRDVISPPPFHSPLVGELSTSFLIPSFLLPTTTATLSLSCGSFKATLFSCTCRLYLESEGCI